MGFVISLLRRLLKRTEGREIRLKCIQIDSNSEHEVLIGIEFFGVFLTLQNLLKTRFIVKGQIIDGNCLYPRGTADRHFCCFSQI